MEFNFASHPQQALFNDLMVKTTSSVQPTYETVEQIPHELPYEEKMCIPKIDSHIGQRKLLLSEVQFLNNSTSEYVVYAGSAPGNKTHLLYKLFPKKKLILVDPNRFDLLVNGKSSHRSAPHGDIVHIKSAYPTKSNTVNVEDEEMVEFIKNSHYGIFIIEDYMTDKLAKIFKDLGQVDFISDIRSNIANRRFPMDLDIAWNNCMMYNWIRIMRPVVSMIKIRMLFGSDPKDQVVPDYILADFATASKPVGDEHLGTVDFLTDYRANVTKMPVGSLYLQCWSPMSSTELRLRINREDIDNIVEYNTREIENKMCYYNSIVRSWACCNNTSADKTLGFCHCADCSLENKIWVDYVNNQERTRESVKSRVLKLVSMTDVATSRPLARVHRLNVWEIILPGMFNRRITSIKKSYDWSTNKRANKRTAINRGNTGRSGGTEPTENLRKRYAKIVYDDVKNHLTDEQKRRTEEYLRS